MQAEHEGAVASIQELVRGPKPNNIPTFSMIARLALTRFAADMRKASAYEREQIWRQMVQGCMVPKTK
jgi:hypothetical protein